MKEAVFTIAYDCLTDQGGRTLNEDSIGIARTSEGVFFLLCDGLGGHGNGDVASAYVVRKMQESLEQGIPLEDCIMAAQQGLLAKQRAEGAEESMKTTFTCLAVSDREARFAHVGDSRIYLFEKGKLKMHSQDHSVPQMLVNQGVIKEREIRHHEDRSRLLRVMGTEWNSPKYQITEPFSLNDKMSFLLCSDGFWELIDEKDMMKTLRKASSPQQWLSSMEQIVLKNGKNTDMDNYSAITVYIR